MGNLQNEIKSSETHTNSLVVNQCPEFPFFGAKYPDATCIDGELWDLDKGDANGLIWSGDESHPPCPFCNTDAFIDYFTDIDDEELEKMNKDNNLSEQDKKDILECNRTKKDAIELAQAIKSKYK